MTGWPTFSPWRSTSSTKLGLEWLLNDRLKTSMQLWPHDGVAAVADSVLAAPTPPTSVSAAAVAKTLLLIDMKLLLGTATVPCARLSSYRRRRPADGAAR